MLKIDKPKTVRTSIPIERDAPIDGSRVQFENTITEVELLKRKPRHQTIKVRLMDDAENVYELWLDARVIDKLGMYL
jgi:hypothetical protein